jgi:3-hydroxyisobutyrate dehydrogenase-like beta-hydroxyacid dehydrogenase
MVGGSTGDLEACRDLWPVMGGTLHHCGPLGSASRMKLVTNLVLGLNRAALAEGLGFARSIGVDPAAALEVLRGSAAQSRVMDTKGRKMLAGEFSPQARLSQHRKDIEIIVRDAAAAGLELPLSSLHLELLRRAEARGLGPLDNSAIARLWGVGT